MADISKIVLGGTTYNIKDAVARAAIAGGMHFLGVSLSEIADATSNVAIIKTGTNTANRYYTGTAPTSTSDTYSGTTYTLKNVALTAGDVVIYGRLEFVFSTSDNYWHELGSTGTLGNLAYKNGISVTYSKATSASFTGTKATLSHSVNQGTVSASGSTSGVAVSSHSYTPAGTISGTVSNGTLGKTTVVRSVDTSKLVTTTIYPQTISAPTGTVTASTADVATANATATSVLTGLTGTKTFVTSAVNASISDETLTLSTASTGTVTASTANLKGVSGTKTVLTGLTGTKTFVTSASLSYADTGTTVATGSVDSDGTGATVATGVSNGNYADAITSLGTPTFSGSFTGTKATINHTVTQGTVSVTGTTSGITVDSHSYTPGGSVTVTNSNASATVTLS